MKKIYSFRKFISEAEMSISNPKDAGDKFAKILGAHKDVKESPKGSNKGPKVTAYLQSTGLPGGNPWCMAFVYYFFDQVFKKIGKKNPLPKTAGVADFWSKTPAANKIDISQARANPEIVKPGMISIMTRSGGGHTGIVVSIDSDKNTFYVLEGNNNDSVVNQKRKLSDKNLTGFVDYMKTNRDEEFDKQMLYAMTSGQNQRTAKVSTATTQKLV